MDHGHYQGRLLSPSLRQILLVGDNERVAEVSNAIQPLSPRCRGRARGCSATVYRGGGYTLVPPAPRRISPEGSWVSDMFPIQRLRILLGYNIRGVCRNVALPIVGGAEFCNFRHMGGTCFSECPWKGSNISPPAGIVDKLVVAMVTARATPPSTISA